MRTVVAACIAALAAVPATAQSVLFDFDSAPVQVALPLDQTVGGITAHLSGGFSIQPVGTLQIAPAGMSGNYIYPDSVSPTDLVVAFSTTIADFSILFAPWELACDTTATLRVTGYAGATFVATNTAQAPAPGTTPSGTLTLAAAHGFDNVAVHYDAVPPVGCDYAPIFFADNMQVTPLDPIFANGFD